MAYLARLEQRNSLPIANGKSVNEENLKKSGRIDICRRATRLVSKDFPLLQGPEG